MGAQALIFIFLHHFLQAQKVQNQHVNTTVCFASILNMTIMGLAHFIIHSKNCALLTAVKPREIFFLPFC